MGWLSPYFLFSVLITISLQHVLHHRYLCEKSFCCQIFSILEAKHIVLSNTLQIFNKIN